MHSENIRVRLAELKFHERFYAFSSPRTPFQAGSTPSLPFGLELSARPWKDGDLLSWAYAYDRD
jgi:hypothetical protein